MQPIIAVSGYDQSTDTFSPDFRTKECNSYNDVLIFLADTLPADILGPGNSVSVTHREIRLSDDHKRQLGLDVDQVSIAVPFLPMHKIPGSL